MFNFLIPIFLPSEYLKCIFSTPCVFKIFRNVWISARLETKARRRSLVENSASGFIMNSVKRSRARRRRGAGEWRGGCRCYAKHVNFAHWLNPLLCRLTRIKASNYRRQIPLSPEPARRVAAIFIPFRVNIPWTSAGSARVTDTRRRARIRLRKVYNSMPFFVWPNTK